jgi:predicted Zn finger-like uncharacterized protein
MILICSKCSASYLVPANVFANGPRQVRCARCSYTWQADLPSDMVVMPKEAPPPPPPAPPQTSFTFSSAGPQAPVKKNAVATEEATPGAEASLEETLPASNLPAIWRNPHWRRIRIGLAIVLGLAAFGFLADMAINGNFVGKIRPAFSPILESTGLMKPVLGDGLSLKQIRSERRFEDGGMHLVLDGEIHNDSTEIRAVPDLQARALGPNRDVIQSWRIEAPAATLPPGATVPFHSSIISPQGTVVEINMNFVEPRHE